MLDKRKLIDKILSIELNMFLKVPTPQPTRCQENREGFKLMRGSIFETWSENTLESYLNDLFEAARKGINLLTQKYARMENLIPPINKNPLIDEIVAMEENWQEEVRQKYPAIIGGGYTGNCGDPSIGCSFFSNYLKSELETYSNQTLESYYHDLVQAKQEGKNILEERYTILFKWLGYNSLIEANESLSKG